MKYLWCMAFTVSFFMTSKVIFDFDKQTSIKDWVIVDDVVMGGVSSGNFSLNSDGFGVFKGEVSLENNGGFSSVRHNLKAPVEVGKYKKIRLRLKGDGKTYQFRIKSKLGNYYTYVYAFQTTGQWENIDIALQDMYPSFRGQKLKQPNFSSSSFEQMAFLIANKKQEKFKILIDKIAFL